MRQHPTEPAENEYLAQPEQRTSREPASVRTAQQEITSREPAPDALAEMLRLFRIQAEALAALGAGDQARDIILTIAPLPPLEPRACERSTSAADPEFAEDLNRVTATLHPMTVLRLIQIVQAEERRARSPTVKTGLMGLIHELRDLFNETNHPDRSSLSQRNSATMRVDSGGPGAGATSASRAA